MPINTMMTPKALNQLVQLGAVSSNTLARCCHREFRGEVWQCSQPAMVICGACGSGTCLDASRVRPVLHASGCPVAV